MSEVFLDTSFAIALIAETDKHHPQAKELADDFEQRRTRLVTTRAVFLEIGNAFSKSPLRAKAIGLLELFEEDPQVEIVPLSESLYQRGFDLFRRWSDKEWSLVDCLSFIVMQERGLTDSLTTDRHFRQAGFRVLLS
ncbi:MAG: type II toxin-antitoxin system VapC family toxin [Thermoanaerobaculia bacterium]